MPTRGMNSQVKVYERPVTALFDGETGEILMC